MSKNRSLFKRYHFIILLSLLLTFSIVSILIGSEILAFDNLISGILEDNKFRFILLEIRVPRVLTALFSGAALATSGLLMQSFFRNPLAGPYILGISAGSGLGVALLLMFGTLVGWELTNIFEGIMLFSVLGSAGVLALVMFLARRIGNGGMLLIVGLMIGSFASAIVGVLQFFAPSEQIKKYLLWTMGDLSSVEMNEMIFFALGIILFVFFALMHSNSLNALLLGEEQAKSLGVNVPRTKIYVILVAGVLAGWVTAYCGPIAFVGLAAPHIAKIWLKTSNHRVLIPANLLLGALLLVACDLIAQVPGSGIILPINAVTSIIGAPLVISIILRNRKNWANG